MARNRISEKKSSKSEHKLFKKLSKRISFVLLALPDVKTVEVMPSSRKLPIARLGSAASQFLKRNYENSILESAFAAEYGLIFILNNELSIAEKTAIEQRKNGLGLTKAINLSRGKIISADLANDLVLLNNLRNMSAHPSNWITLLNQLVEMAENEKITSNWLLKATNLSDIQMADRLKEKFDVKKAEETIESMGSYAEANWGDLPDLKWATNKDTLQFQLDYVKNYFKPMARDLIIKQQIIPLIDKPKSAPTQLMDKYNFPQELAIKSLSIAYNTLKELEILTTCR
jgi:hypothetical protein